MNVVYILFSTKLDRFYIGYSSNLDIRMEFHQNADYRKYTAKADDWVMFFTIPCESKKQGLGFEKHIKKMKSKIYIQNLLKYPEIDSKLLLKYKDC